MSDGVTAPAKPFRMRTVRAALAKGVEKDLRAAVASAMSLDELLAVARLLAVTEPEAAPKDLTMQTLVRLLDAHASGGADRENDLAMLETKARRLMQEAGVRAYAAGNRSPFVTHLAITAAARTTDTRLAAELGAGLMATRPLSRRHIVAARQLLHLGYRQRVADWIATVEGSPDLDACDDFFKKQFGDMAAHVPRDGGAGSSILIYRREASKRVVFAFCGQSNRFGVGLDRLAELMEQLDAHLVILKDIDVLFFMSGVAGLGEGVDATATGMRALAQELGADEILCMGSSSGGYPAIRYGLKTGAARVVVFAGFSNLSPQCPEVVADPRAEALMHRTIREVGPELVDCRQELVRRSPPMPLDMFFGADMPSDRFQAENVEGAPGVTLHAIPGLNRHGVVQALDKAGRMPGILADFVEGRPLR